MADAVNSDASQRRADLVEKYLDLSPIERDSVHRFIRDLIAQDPPDRELMRAVRDGIDAVLEESERRYRAEREARLAAPDVLRWEDGTPVA